MGRFDIKFNINPKLFNRDPQDSEYGHKLLKNSILLLDEIGFEGFTFKKLAIRIDSTESSVYRYFNNKHFLLLFLTCWYWEWVHYLIITYTRNIEDPVKRLKIAVHNIVNASNESPLTEYINENKLHEVVIKEGSKAYHVHDIDEENKEGLFKSYKELVSTVSSLISEVNPDFPYPHILASNMFEMANNQIFFAEHLPKLTDIKNRQKKYQDLEGAMWYMVQKILM